MSGRKCGKAIRGFHKADTSETRSRDGAVHKAPDGTSAPSDSTVAVDPDMTGARGLAPWWAHPFRLRLSQAGSAADALLAG